MLFGRSSCESKKAVFLQGASRQKRILKHRTPSREGINVMMARSKESAVPRRPRRKSRHAGVHGEKKVQTTSRVAILSIQGHGMPRCRLASLDGRLSTECTFAENISSRGSPVLAKQLADGINSLSKSLEGDFQSQARVVYSQPRTIVLWPTPHATESDRQVETYAYLSAPRTSISRPKFL
jgi:hypothetical protein